MILIRKISLQDLKARVVMKLDSNNKNKNNNNNNNIIIIYKRGKGGLS